MKDGPLGFTIFPHRDGVFDHHFKVGPFPSDLTKPYSPGPLLKADEELGRPRELVDIKKNMIVDFICVTFQVQGGDAYPLGLDDLLDSVDLCNAPLI